MKLFGTRHTEPTQTVRQPKPAEPPTTTRHRVAVIQIDYQPAAVLSYPMIEEPALLAEGEPGITTLQLSTAALQDRLRNLRQKVAGEHEQFVNTRLPAVLSRLDALAVDIAGFPECSIPDICLQAVANTASTTVL
jgi:hypothetical protein